MPRGKKKIKQQPNKLLEALQFISVCQVDKGTHDSEMYCNLIGKTAVAFDGVIAAGVLIDEGLDACPHTHQMILALSRCGENMQIVQTSPETLKISSAGFEAFVPCCKRERLTAVNPEGGNIPVAPGLTSAIDTASPLVSDKADILEAVSLQLNQNSVLATDREVVIEVWHGSNLPFGEFLIPKQTLIALKKIKKQITHIGIKPNVAALFPNGKDQNLHESMTFWFSNGTWLKTQLHKGKWRDNAYKLLKSPSNQVRPISKTFFDTVNKVLPFSQDDKIYCGQGRVASHSSSNLGGIYSLPVEDSPNNKVYKGKNLLFVGKTANTIDEHQQKNCTLFYGPNTRYAVWHDNFDPTNEQLSDDDIPF